MSGTPGASSVHNDATLQNVAINHVSEFEQLTKVCPVVPVNKKSDYFFIYDEADVKRAIAGEVSDEGAPERIGYKLSTSTYQCVNRAIEATVSDDERDNADAPIDPDVDKTMLVMDAHARRREMAIATLLTTSANWTGSLDVSTTTQWDDEAATIFDQIGTACQGVADYIEITPNTFATSRKVFWNITKSPSMKTYIDQSSTPDNPALATANTLRSIYGFTNIVVSSGIRVTSAEGASTTTRASIFGNYAWVGYVAPNPSPRLPSACYCFTWKRPMVQRYREQRYRRDVIQGVESYDPKKTWANAGYLFSNCLASF